MNCCVDVLHWHAPNKTANRLKVNRSLVNSLAIDMNHARIVRRTENAVSTVARIKLEQDKYSHLNWGINKPHAARRHANQIQYWSAYWSNRLFDWNEIDFIGSWNENGKREGFQRTKNAHIKYNCCRRFDYILCLLTSRDRNGKISNKIWLACIQRHCECARGTQPPPSPHNYICMAYFHSI